MVSIHDIPDEELRRGDIAITILCFMDFKTNPQRWFLGYDKIEAEGHTWIGRGDMIQISELEASYGMSAGMARFEIPKANPQMLAATDDQEREVNGRLCQVFGQLFASSEDGAGGHAGRAIGSPFVLFSGRMRNVSSTDSAERRDITLEAYGRLSWKGRPPFGRWTAGDQRRRYPGDAGLDLLPSLQDKAVTWMRT